MFRRFDVCKLAAEKMLEDNFIIFDTETTGLGPDDEIIEMGVIDCHGQVLYEGMFRPEQRMNPAASRVSGITDEMLANQPRFADEFWTIIDAMTWYPGLIAFNESFDERMFYQTARKYGLDTRILDQLFKDAYCAEALYDQYIGYDKTKLELACETEGIEMVQTHRATDDCVMTLELLKCIADRRREPNYEKYCEVRAKATGKTAEEVSRPLSSPAKKKDESYIEYAKLHNEGKSVAEIAAVKKVQVRTVQERLVDAFKHDAIKCIDALIQPQFENGIRKIIASPEWDGRFTSVKRAMPDGCDWITIRAVIAKAKKEKAAALSFEDKLEDATTRSGGGAIGKSEFVEIEGIDVPF